MWFPPIVVKIAELRVAGDSAETSSTQAQSACKANLPIFRAQLLRDGCDLQPLELQTNLSRRVALQVALAACTLCVLNELSPRVIYRRRQPTNCVDRSHLKSFNTRR